MLLDLKIKGNIVPTEFEVKEIYNPEGERRLWVLGPSEASKGMHELTFLEADFILYEIKKRPNDLHTSEEILIELINDFLRLEHANRQEGFDDSVEGGDSELQPYDPKQISIRNERWSLSHVFEMIDKYNYIDLSPDFQRNFVWDLKRRSQLIESLMLRIPVPAFYLAETESGGYQVVDGLQRLTTIRDFMKNRFYLKGLEYLKEQEGKYFSFEDKKEGIDPGFIMTINLTQINVNIIEAKSPAKVKFDVFRRVNTGGKPLNNQEIRNCLASPKTRKLINELAHSDEFKLATGGSVRTTRMQAQELVLRFIAFYHNVILDDPAWTYKGNMTEYLDDAIDLLNEKKAISGQDLSDHFMQAMKNAYHLFGKFAFRKNLPDDLIPGARKQLINKSLFTTWSILLSQLDHERLVTKVGKEEFPYILAEKLQEDKDFLTSVSYKTNDRQYLNIAFRETAKLINEHLKDG